MSLELNTARSAARAGHRPESRAYVVYLLTVLLLINICNFIDRQLPFILAQSIKRDLALSDQQIGLFGGLAFAIIYPFLGLPLARLADRYGRKWVLAGSLLLWSLLTISTGFARSFWQLTVARSGVSAAEAGSTPSAHALIASYYPLARRSVPLAIFSLGVPIGSMLALMLGGWINDVAGWRSAFVWVGMPGLFLALLTLFTINEPAREHPGDRSDLTLWQTIRLLSGKSSFRHLAIAIGVYSMGANAMIVFTPAFLMRSHAFSATSAGLSLGLLYGTAGVAGTLLGGVLGDRLGARDQRWRLWGPALGLLVAVPCTAGAWLVEGTPWCLGLLTVPKFSNLLYIAPVFAALQTLVPANARATASSFLLLFNSLIGLAFGPVIVGTLSDLLSPTFGDEALRYALSFVPVTQAWAAVHFLLAAGSLRQDLDPAHLS